ncbi:aminoacyl-tRNA hydrolase [Methylomonas sp. MgM2]
MIKLMVGLGNPGRQYEKTRHNAGFLFLDYLAEAHRVKWSSSGQFHGEISNISLGDAKLVLLKPTTYMNRSGLSVGNVMRYYKYKPDQLLVVHDELDLAEGVVKMKRGGGHAGHNGLRDIIAHLGSNDFYRLRVGIGRPRAGGNVADYVLSEPASHAMRLFEETFGVLEQNLEVLLAGDVSVANNKIAV